MGNSFSCISSKQGHGSKSESRQPRWKKLFRRDSHRRVRSETNKELYAERDRIPDQELKLEDNENNNQRLSAPKEAAPLVKKPAYDLQAPPSNVTLRRPIAWSIDFSQPPVLNKEEQHDEKQPEQPGKSPDFIGCGDNQQKDENEADEISESETVRKNNTDGEEWEPIGRVRLHKHYEWDGDEWIPCIWPPSDVNKPTESDEDDATSKKAEMYRAIASALEVVLQRVEASYDHQKVNEEVPDEDMTPPEIEGDIYNGPSVLKATRFGGISSETRCVTWEVDVKPSGADEPVLDQITESFARERSNLLLKRAPEEHQRQRTARLARQWYVDYFSKYAEPEKKRSMLPVRVKGWKPESSTYARKVCRQSISYRPIKTTEGCRIPVLIKTKPAKTHIPLKTVHIETILRRTDGSLIWPDRLEDIASASARAYFLEQFQKTQLFKQRQRKMRGGDKAWALGLTSFQRWATMNVCDSMTTNSSSYRASRRNSMAKSRISTWRRTGPAIR